MFVLSKDSQPQPLDQTIPNLEEEISSLDLGLLKSAVDRSKTLKVFMELGPRCNGVQWGEMVYSNF